MAVDFVDDLKSWVLSGDRAQRVLTFISGGQPNYRKYNREEVLKRYLQTVVSSLPKEKQASQFWLLMPSIADEERHNRYRATLEKAVPGAYFLPEPEMVVEYFRLVRRQLVLTRGRTGIFLVVDAGAATCNFTFILTRKDEKVVSSSEGRRRVSRLRAVRGDAALVSGRWVDKAILDTLGIDATQFDRPVLQDLLATAERLKVRVSESGKSGRLHHDVLSSEPELDVSHLKRLARDLWKELAKVYMVVAKRFLEQIQDTEHAQEQFGPLLREHKVSSERDVQHLVDAVILAGGSSQLPGFEQAMKDAVFPDAKDLRILQVGREYPVAAAVGALAHILHQQYNPRRIRGSSDSSSNLETSAFQGMLPTDVFLEWKYKNGKESTSIPVLSRSEPFAEKSGTRPISGLPAFERDASLIARLLPRVEKSRRKGFQPTSLQVKKEPGHMNLRWNAVTREVHVTSPDVLGVGKLFLSMNQLVDDALPHDDLSKMDIPPGMLLAAAAQDVVIDVGMSKTVMVTAQGGLFSVRTLLDPVKAAPPVPVRVALGEPGSAAVPPTPSHKLSERDSQVAEQPIRYGGEVREDVYREHPHAERESEAPPASVAAADGSSDHVEAIPSPAVPVVTFGEQLARVIGETRMAGIREVGADLTMLLLALSVRPFVLLAGPPGSGKSTLVRIAAKLLNAKEDKSYFEILVQPHWRREEDLPEQAKQEFQAKLSEPLRVFLFDEFNLARPEHYLMPFFRMLDASARQPSRGRMLACGTLNIDDTSRPPSPKIMDRCFMIEIDAPTAGPQPGLSMLLSEIDVLPEVSLPIMSELADGKPPRLWEPVEGVLEVIRNCVRTRNLRQDLLPSRRGLNDIAALLHLYDVAGIPQSLLPEDELIDRALAGRMLVKLSGAAEQVEPLVDALGKHFKALQYTRCSRRIDLARAQIPQMGFVSPWQ